MRYWPHAIFRKSQSTVQFELPNDVLFDSLSFVKRINNQLDNGYRLTADDIFCMAMEDLLACYMEDLKGFLKRVQQG